MGLLDGLFGDPSSQALWALGSGLLGVRRGDEGKAFMNTMGAYNNAQQEQRRNKLTDAQLKEIEAQAAQRQAMADQLKQQQERQAQLSGYLVTIGQPQYAPGSTVMKPETMANPTRTKLDPLTLIRLGMPVDSAQKLASVQDWGRPEVSHWYDSQGPNGEPVVRGATKYGDPVPFSAQKYSEYRDPAALAGKTQVASAGASKQMTLVNAFEPFQNALQKEMGQNLAKTQEQLQFAGATLDNIAKAKALVPQAGPFVGSGAETKLAAVKFLNNNLGLGIKEDAVKSAEELRSRVFIQIMDNLKKMDAQPSQMQQQIMMDALGKLGTDPGALPQVLNVFEDVIRNKVGTHNQRVKEFTSQPGVKLPYDLSIKLPEAAPALDPNALRQKYGLPPL